MKEIRHLVENYYDIQKMRIECFNRIVCYVKENKDKIKLELMKKNLNSQYYLENQGMNASHNIFENQTCDASQKHIENHSYFASHRHIENHWKDANQKAIELLDKNKYAEFVKFCLLKNQEDFKEIENLVWFYNSLLSVEKELYKRLDAWSKEHPLRKHFLNYVKGIGPILSSGIISWLSKAMLKAEKPSSIWKYCGLYPNSEREKGKKLDYNPRLKTFCWKIGESFIKSKCFGRKLYDIFKEQTKQKHPDWTKLHIHNYAKRKVVKIFLACLWAKWREMNNLPITNPYPIDILGHKDVITWYDWIEKGGVKE